MEKMARPTDSPALMSPDVERDGQIPGTPGKFVDTAIEAINGWPQQPPSRADAIALMKQSPPGSRDGQLVNVSDDVKADYERFYPWFPPAPN